MKTGKPMLRRLEHWHIISLLMGIYDVFAVNAVYFLSLWFRFDCTYSEIPALYLDRFLRFIPLSSVLCVGVFLCMRLYNVIWRFAGINELIRCVAAVVVNTALHLLLMSFLFGRMPVSYYVIGFVLHMIATLGIRFSYRFVLAERARYKNYRKHKRILLVGAGEAGQMILHSVQHRQRDTRMQVCCFIDDNPNKWGRDVSGVPVVGGRDSILSAVKRYRIDWIFVAIPSATEEQRRQILNICKESGCELKILPGIDEIINGDVSVNSMKEVAVEDLLGREPIRVNMEEIYTQISGKTIMVTGGGGSIGSELCRQVAAHKPGRLVIFEVYENSAYEIEQELRRQYPQLDLHVRIGSVRDSRCLDSIFETYRPDIVYHAAAHKHVPLMESSPCEAIKNNVIGTYKTAHAAMTHGCSRFVLISTDKAVNPTNIMGASKRLCEMVIQTFDQAVKSGTAEKLPLLFTHHVRGLDGLPESGQGEYRTEFVAVRFGNVLGSNGSVIPLFKKQIQAGGPVTVTHPDIIRYFMTIPEAVSLVMQAGTYAKGGEIFVLDMGAPVKIDELARNLIKLSGHRPDEDIKVVYTGLRPGEKLYEEKLMAEEGMKKTDNDLIHIGNPIPFEVDAFLSQLKKLMQAAYENDDAIRSAVAAMVPTYRPQNGGAKDATFEQLHKQAVAPR
ncbi:MAG: polysaccharide biosynthesis protein [Oscillospiraceae bacterium]|nr:polysaccharide biosynthesis protein [Oscillospiraceae bacterium]